MAQKEKTRPGDKEPSVQDHEESPKMRAAREELVRLQRRAVPLGPTGNTIADEKPPHCKVQFDRTDVGCRGIDMDGLTKIPGFRRTRRHWIKKKRPEDFIPYGCITTFQSTTSAAQFWVYSEPQSRRLPRFKVTFIPEDKVGLGIAMLRPVSTAWITRSFRCWRLTSISPMTRGCIPHTFGVAAFSGNANRTFCRYSPDLGRVGNP